MLCNFFGLKTQIIDLNFRSLLWVGNESRPKSMKTANKLLDNERLLLRLLALFKPSNINNLRRKIAVKKHQ